MRYLVLAFLVISNLAFAGNEQFDNTLAVYEKLHQAFYQNDLKKIKAEAKNLLDTTEKIKDEKIGKTLTYTKKKLNEILKSDDLKEIKKAFNTISQGLLVVLEKHAPNKNYSRYYCPMEKKYWIQNTAKTDEVQNPYASEKMPHCGLGK